MGETACLITIMFRMRRTELECRRGVLLLRPLCCRSLCRNMFPYTGSKQIPDIAFDLTELLGSVNREAQIKAEGKMFPMRWTGSGRIIRSSVFWEILFMQQDF